MRSGSFRGAIQDGALALEFGWDPIRYLSLAETERLLAREVLQEAVDRRALREKDHWKNMQAAIQNGVARAFGGKN